MIKSTTFRAAALFALGVCITSTASAQWMITDLGDLPGGGNSSRAADINNAGQVVGVSQAAAGGRAFMWQNGVMTDLGTLGSYTEAYGINNAGQVVGVSSSPTNRAFMWQNGVMTDLGVPAGAAASVKSRGVGINDAGQVVVNTENSNGSDPRAFILQNGVMTSLGSLPGGSGASYAHDINSSGQVVGNSSAPTGGAFMWQNGVMTNLGSLPGASSSNALGINTAGQVVGHSGGRAFMWQNGVMSDLGGDAPTGGSLYGGTLSAYDINNAGQVVGYGVSIDGDTDSNVERAVLWQSGSMIDLSTAGGVAGTGWILKNATAVNDLGQIVGYGTNPQGETHAFMLTPVPEPEVYLMMGVGVCLAGVIARRRKQIS